MRTTLLATAALGGLLALAAPAPAQADVIYTFTPTTVTRTPPLANPFPFPTRGAGFSLELTDAAVADGSFALSARFNNSPGFPPLYTGDLGEFVSFSVAGGTPATPTFLIGSLNLSLTFSPSGDVVSGRVVATTFDTELDLGISGNFVSGYFGSDEPTCNASASARVCFESGPLVRTNTVSNVPEPASLALLGTGTLGMGMVARRRRDRPAV